MTEKVWDVVVFGSGPAGLTAAIYTVRGNASTLVLAGEKWGGQLMLTTLVENYPGFPDGIQGPDLMLAMRKQAERFGAKFLEKNFAKIDTTKRPFELLDSQGAKYFAKSAIIATGAVTSWLNVPGESQLIGRGVSTCAPCDAPFFKDRKVVVVGGGDSAMEEALVLTKYASQVTIVHRRNEFRASKVMQDKVLTNPKIKVIWDTEVTEVVGNQKVESIKIKNSKTNKTGELIVDGVFVAIGHYPASEFFKGAVEMDEKGFVKHDHENYHSATNIPGLFVAGDVMDKHYKQAITAAGMGCMAAMDALSYLDNVKGLGQNG